MSQVKSIVITGGPCGAKTTASRIIQRDYEDRVLVGPEVASILLAGGYPKLSASNSSVDDQKRWLEHFQSAVLPVQLSLEEQLKANALANSMIGAVFDRGRMDCAAYWPGERASLLEKFDLDLTHELGRYDGVIHFQSVADFNPALYDQLKTTNPSRYENAEEARKLDHRIKEAWEGHPNWHFISGEGGVDSVMSQASALLSKIFDKEIEKKWLLLALPDLSGYESISIEQGYIIANDQSEMRLRKYGNQHFLTIKGEGGVERDEWERSIPKHFFDLLWPATLGRRIFKTRYFIPWQGYRLELDIYHGKRQGRITLECEFKSESSSLCFTLPDWAAGAIDITNSDDDKNKNQAG